jgi:flagellar P-ring protein precursor FlgI
MKFLLLRTLALIAALGLAAPAQAERIKDLASVQGVRFNQLSGYGLVVGLDGTGDQTTQTPFTVQSLTSPCWARWASTCRPAPTCS